MIIHLIIGIIIVFAALLAIIFNKCVINLVIYLKLLLVGIVVSLLFVAEKTGSADVLQLLHSAPYLFSAFAVLGCALIFNFVKYFSDTQNIDGEEKC